MSDPYYQKNPILKDPTVNVTFDQILGMRLEEFDGWVKHSRSKILEAWNAHGCPARSGRSFEEMVSGFNAMSSAPISKFEYNDELTPNERGTVIINNLHLGTEVDQFFSNMMKVAMCYGLSTNGYSVYDMFANDKYLPSMLKRSRRHFRRDSFYHYSLCIKKHDIKSALVDVDNGVEWIHQYYLHINTIFKDHDFWIQESEVNTEVSTGYYQVKQSDFLALTKEELIEVHGKYGFSHINLANITINQLKDGHIYLIRMFEKGQKLYPKAFTAYRIGYISVPINFPPLTAKYIYEKYTDHLVGKADPIVVYDPSSGWAGRILGAMTVSTDRKIHYVGTDPNPDNIHTDGKSKYEHVADFVNTHTYRNNPLFGQQNTYDVYQEGSEEIHKHPRFQQYKGNVDLIFTSPPYFNREKYSNDDKQSAIKYGSSYKSWRDGFLIPTLNTCVEWLKPGGYLLWNIADVLAEGNYLPLEKDSVDTLLSLGLVQEPTLKMTLASMPGAQRLDENGIPKCKNYCKVNGKYHKYEPIFVFKKPIK